MEITKKQPFDYPSSFSIKKTEQNLPLQKETPTGEGKQPNSELKPNQENVEKEKVVAQIESMNTVFDVNMTSLKFNLHEETERFYVEIQDQKTKEVIKEIPTKEFLDLMARITEFTGILIDKKI
ncbi:flagellar protein FlaG [Bacillus dakarensis]|uniref:flagellar protein FlaG n=1 Tax=Robertmurraya dakarensis TaxID=1926278 RepID=UPI000980F22C|nr:flagellar protein FlaG [Bacillus dakarensis]